MSDPVSILKRSITLYQCPSTWLPEDSVDLAEELEPIQPKRRVWFPVDETGEPHEKNPNDGFGGAVYSLCQIKEFERSIVNKSHLAKNQVLAQDSLARLKIGFSRVAVWNFYVKNWDKLEDPNFVLCGLVWRKLFGRRQRTEEVMLANEEREAAKREEDLLAMVSNLVLLE